MPSIFNGLFAARSGLSAHGTAIGVIGDNIANVSTPGFKQTRAEFWDLVAGGLRSSVISGSGAGISQIAPINNQGTLEDSGRPMDLAIDGNGFFVVADGQQRYYSRAGNFRIDPSGNIVSQSDFKVLGFPSNGSGILEQLNINSISQDNVATTSVKVAGNVDASATTLTNGVSDIPTVSYTDVTAGSGTPSTTTYAELNAVAAFTTSVEVFDSLGQSHTINFYFFKTNANEYTARGYVNSEDVDDPTAGTAAGLPRLVYDGSSSSPASDITMTFAGDGSRSPAPTVGTPDLTGAVTWNNGSTSSSVDITFDPFTQFSTNANILSITQDGQGVGNVTSISIEKNGEIFAVLDNGQSSIIGTIALANFASAEGLTRVGNNLLQQSPNSGEPVVGRPDSGTFGTVNSGSIELSTVDIANEFVRLISYQRGFQANSKIITTINQLLDNVINLG